MLRGKVTNVTSAGVFVQTADYGTVGPCQAVVANYAVGDMVLCDNVGDEASPELVVVGRLTGTGSTTSGSSVDNTVARFDGTGGALQGSGVTINDSAEVAASGYVRAASGAVYDQWFVDGVRRFVQQTAPSSLGLFAADDSGVWSGSGKKVWEIDRATGKVTLMQVGAAAGLEFGSGGPRIMAGTGSPESVVSAPVGSLWLRTDSSTTLYVKQTGTGNTGWIAK
jgi:hypothetical protein